MNQPKQKPLVVFSLIVAGIMVLALATAFLTNYSKLKEVFLHLEMGPLFFALFSTGSAYLSSALSFRALFKLTPHRIPFSKFFSVMFISDTVNFIISSAGMSSIAIRAFLLKQEKIPLSITIPLSLAQNMIFNLVLSCVSFGGLVYLQGHPEFKGGPKQTVLLTFMTGLTMAAAGMMLFFFNGAFRRGILGLILEVGRWLNHQMTRENNLGPRWAEMQDQLESTLSFLRKGWIQLTVVFFWIAVDWCFMAMALYFCFRAVGVDLPLGLLVVGFTVMFLSSNINPVPAGLGVSESLLAFTFKILGVDFEKTLVAALLFRLVYYLIPLGISTGLYIETIRFFLKSQAEDKPG